MIPVMFCIKTDIFNNGQNSTNLNKPTRNLSFEKKCLEVNFVQYLANVEHIKNNTNINFQSTQM